MLHHLVPEPDAKAELPLESVACVFQPTHCEVILVSILRTEIKSLQIIVIRSRRGTRLAKPGKERKVLRQKQRAVVVIVVAVKPIRHWRLRRNCLDRWMPVDAGH